ncbi:MAG: chemotaxis protein CheX [Thermoguttaceae bacterium]|nr:chemotaxis protein CheX [Thermoguttaceae bacterium]MDW8077714.1 chemotaxis protein CheX [Thermoguttaceae bacterium]
MSNTAMRVEHINPFISAVLTTFRTMLGWELRRGKPVVKRVRTADHQVSGVIGLSGKAVGTVVLSFSEQVALKAASALLLEDLHEINTEVLDAVGELTNMVAGAAKAQLEEYQLSVSLPNVVTGHQHMVHFPSTVTPISIPFETEHGPFTLEVALAPQEELVRNN